MAQIAHYYGKVTADDTVQGTSGVYTDYLTVPSTEFVGSAKYLVLWKLASRHEHASGHTFARLAWATTGAIAGTDTRRETVSTSVTIAQQSVGARVITAPATPEDLKIQISQYTQSGFGGETFNANIFVMRLDENLTEGTDWHYVSDDLESSTTKVTRSSIVTDYTALTKTFTAGKWLVITSGIVNLTSSGASIRVRQVNTGGGTTSTNWPYMSEEGESAKDRWPYASMGVYDLDGTSATFAHGCNNSAGSSNHIIKWAETIAINLDKFEENKVEETLATLTTPASTSVYENVEKIASFSPATVGPWFFFGSVSWDVNATGLERITVDGTDVLGDDFTIRHIFADARDQYLGIEFGVADLAATSGDINLDAINTNATADWDEHRLYGFSLELAGGGGGPTVYELTFTSGAVTTTGQSFTLAANRELTFTTGAVSIDGQTFTPAVTRLLTFSTADVATAGQTFALAASRNLTFSTAAVSVDGNTFDMTFVPGGGPTVYELTFTGGDVAVSGNTFTPVATRALTFSAGDVSVSGGTFSLALRRSLTFSTADIAVDGGVFAPVVTRSLSFTPGTVDVSGNNFFLSYSESTEVVMHRVVNGEWVAGVPYIRVGGEWKLATPYTVSGGVWKTGP